MKSKKGVTLIEAVIVIAILSIIVFLVLRGIDVFNYMFFQHLKTRQLNALNSITYEIGRVVRGSRKIISVEPGTLGLEVYDYSSYPPGDKRAILNPRKVIYRFVHVPPAEPAIFREVYSSTAALTPESSLALFKSAYLFTPTDSDPYFKAMYFVGSSTVGVQLSVTLKNNITKEKYVPLISETQVYGRQI